MACVSVPDIPNSFVPELLGRPRPANQPAPLRKMVGDTATVSTFVTVVGQPNNPMLAGKGGFRRGLPCRPCFVHPYINAS